MKNHIFLNHEDTQFIYEIMCLITEFQKNNCLMTLKEIEDKLIINQSISNICLTKRSFKNFFRILKHLLKKNISIIYRDVLKRKEEEHADCWWYLHNPTPNVRDIDKERKENLKNTL